VIERRFGRYRLVSQLGQGGLASVWRAHDSLLGRTVALKLLHGHLCTSSKARRRFLHEAQTAAALDHPGIVAVFDAGESGGRAFIALGLVEGETVSACAAHRLMPIVEATRIACAAADALGYAHEHRVIHRDVTGRNIMVGDDGRVHVLDFGLALAAWESRITSTRTPMGTVPYMAPEIIRGLEADARTDLYGLGVVLYEMLTGALPFTGEQAESVLYAAANLDPVAPRARRPEIPVELERFVLNAIAREPDARPQTAKRFLDALQGLGLGEEAPSVPPARTRVEARPERASRDGALEQAATLPLPPHYVAVLPFEVADAQPDAEAVSATLAARLGETLGCALAKGRGTHVVPVPAGGLPRENREIARVLGANLLLRGSVRRHGMQVRVTYAVLDPWAELQIAGDVVTGSALQPFDVEDQVAASVARALGIDAQPCGPHAPRPPDPAAADHYRQALGYLKRYDSEAAVDGAIALLERLVDSEGDEARYHAALTRAYLYKHRLTRERVWQARAAAACDRAHGLDPEAAEVRIALGYLRLDAGQHATALAEFDGVLVRSPDSHEARLGRARALADAGRLAEAHEACGDAVAEQPEDWRAHSLLGWVRGRQHRFADALEPYQRVVALVPDNARAPRSLGNALYRLGRFEEAVQRYRDSLAIQPSDEGYGNLGAALYALGRYEEAITAFRTAATLTPGDPLRWGNLGVACRWVPGHIDEAAPLLDRAIGLMRDRLERNPSRADWWGLLADWLADRGLLDEARVSIRRAIELDPEDADCMLRAGHVYFQLGEREECLRWFRKARDAGFPTAEWRRSPALAELRKDPEFIRILDDG